MTQRCAYCWAPVSGRRSPGDVYCCDEHRKASEKHPTIQPLTRAEVLKQLKRA